MKGLIEESLKELLGKPRRIPGGISLEFPAVMPGGIPEDISGGTFRGIPGPIYECPAQVGITE